MKKKVYTKPDSASLTMPCGNTVDLARPRSDGIMTDQELAFCRAKGVSLAYDPVQIGWISALAEDDFSPIFRKNERTPRNAVAYKPQVNALHPQYRLRPWTSGDLPVYMSLLDDPDVWTYMTEEYPDPLTEEEAAALIELSNASNHHQVFAVLRNTKPVGQVRLLFDVDPLNPATAEISYWLGREHWGKGIGSDIVRLFTKRCFADNIGITKLIARVHRDNGASSAILTKAGYLLQGHDPKDQGWTLFAKHRTT
jgi:RimJ/RimL family protein N-acetyltransferase